MGNSKLVFTLRIFGGIMGGTNTNFEDKMASYLDWILKNISSMVKTETKNYLNCGMTA